MPMFLLICCLPLLCMGWEHHGVVFGGGEWTSPSASLGSAAAETSLRAAAAAGVNSIRLIPQWFQDTVNTTSIYRGADGPFTTSSDAAFETTIALAKSLKMKVMVSPVIDPNWALPTNSRDGYPGAECILWRTGKVKFKPKGCTKEEDVATTGRGQIGIGFSDGDWGPWFASYTNMTMGYAKMAQASGVDTFCVAAEMPHAMTLKSNVPHWQKLIALLRTVYKGNLTVAANTFTVVPFARDLDILGFDMYRGLTLSDLKAGPEPPSVQELAAAWQPYIAFLKNVSMTMGKPILATELGFQSRPRSFMSPAGSTRFGAGDCSVYMKCYSMQDQQLAYEALYSAFEVPAKDGWFLGNFWWLWRSDPTAGGVNDNSFTPHRKPAAKSMAEFAKRHRIGVYSDDEQHSSGSPNSVAASGRHPSVVTRTVAPTVTPTLAPTFRTAPARGWGSKQNGVVFGSAEWTSFESPSGRLDSKGAASSLQKAKAVGVNSIELIPTWFFDSINKSSTHMWRGQDTKAPDALATDTDDELRAIIKVKIN
jgi:hypothetical protein